MKKQQQGFTIAELLIVVAIIAVLVAVAIPKFADQLETAREGVDVSALRGAYAAGTLKILGGVVNPTNEESGAPELHNLRSYMRQQADDAAAQGEDDVEPITYYYDSESGNLISADDEDEVAKVASYMKGTNFGNLAVVDVSGLPKGVAYDFEKAVAGGEVVDGTAWTLPSTNANGHIIQVDLVYDADADDVVLQVGFVAHP